MSGAWRPGGLIPCRRLLGMRSHVNALTERKPGLVWGRVLQYLAPHDFGPEHEQFRAGVHAFVAREIAPHVNAWDEAEGFPCELCAHAATLARQLGIVP